MSLSRAVQVYGYYAFQLSWFWLLTAENPKPALHGAVQYLSDLLMNAELLPSQTLDF